MKEKKSESRPLHTINVALKQVFLNPNVRTRSQLTYEYDLIKSVCILILSDSPKAPDAMTMMKEMNFIF